MVIGILVLFRASDLGFRNFHFPSQTTGSGVEHFIESQVAIYADRTYETGYYDVNCSAIGYLGLSMNELRARYVHLDSQGQDYVRILGGPPESVTMRSGLVVLAPGQSVGEHSTEDFEELIIVLQGEGQAQIKGRKAIGIREGIAVYIPPETDHNIQNTGDSTLRYIYIVAKAIT